jgi:hypothetical protein
MIFNLYIMRRLLKSAAIVFIMLTLLFVNKAKAQEAARGVSMCYLECTAHAQCIICTYCVAGPGGGQVCPGNGLCGDCYSITAVAGHYRLDVYLPGTAVIDFSKNITSWTISDYYVGAVLSGIELDYVLWP